VAYHLLKGRSRALLPATIKESLMSDLIKKLAASIESQEVERAKESAERLASATGASPLVMIALD